MAQPDIVIKPPMKQIHYTYVLLACIFLCVSLSFFLPIRIRSDLKFTLNRTQYELQSNSSYLQEVVSSYRYNEELKKININSRSLNETPSLVSYLNRNRNKNEETLILSIILEYSNIYVLLFN